MQVCEPHACQPRAVERAARQPRDRLRQHMRPLMLTNDDIGTVLPAKDLPLPQTARKVLVHRHIAVGETEQRALEVHLLPLQGVDLVAHQSGAPRKAQDHARAAARLRGKQLFQLGDCVFVQPEPFHARVLLRL